MIIQYRSLLLIASGSICYLVSSTPLIYLCLSHIAWAPAVILLNLQHHPTKFASDLRGVASCFLGNLFSIKTQEEPQSNVTKGILFLNKSLKPIESSYYVFIGVLIVALAQLLERCVNKLRKKSKPSHSFSIIYFKYCEYICPYLIYNSAAYLLLGENNQIRQKAYAYIIAICIFVFFLLAFILHPSITTNLFIQFKNVRLCRFTYCLRLLCFSILPLAMLLMHNLAAYLQLICAIIILLVNLIWLIIVQPYSLKYINFTEMAIIAVRLMIMMVYLPLCTNRITETLCDRIDTFFTIFMMVIKISLIGFFFGRIAHKIRYQVKPDNAPSKAIIGNNTSSINLVTAAA